MEKILQGIIQSEEEARVIEEEAKRQALAMLTEARRKSLEIIENSVLEGEELSRELLQKARDEAAHEASLQEDSKKQKLDQIRIKSKERLSKAAQYIVERVVN